MGELAKRLGRSRTTYRGLREPALALLVYIGAGVKAISGQTPLIVTSTVRDLRYQRLLVARNIEATRNYSLHTTGWAFDILRRYRSRKQALAFEFMLNRLQSHDLIAWVREPAAIHVTVSSDAERLAAVLSPLSGLSAPRGRIQSSRSRTWRATFSAFMPRWSSTSPPGAEAPKRSIETIASA